MIRRFIVYLLACFVALSQAAAGPIFVYVAPVTASDPFAFSFEDFEQDNTLANPQTFAAKDVGDAAASRLVIAAIHWAVAGSATVSSATIGGVSAAVACESDGSNTGVAVISAKVPSGTTADIVVTWSGTSPARGGVGVWRLTGHASDTAYDFDAPAGGSSASRSVTLDIPGSGIAVAASTPNDGSSTTWTNATERYDPDEMSAADYTATSSETRTITSSAARVICGASWG